MRPKPHNKHVSWLSAWEFAISLQILDSKLWSTLTFVTFVYPEMLMSGIWLLDYYKECKYMHLHVSHIKQILILDKDKSYPNLCERVIAALT